MEKKPTAPLLSGSGSAAGPRLPQATLVEFLTVLPQECEDAAAAAQAGPAEQAFHLKQRVGRAPGASLSVLGATVKSSLFQCFSARASALPPRRHIC